MSRKASFILSGCGYLDGTEINEAVLLSLLCAQHDIEVDFYSVNEDVPVSCHSLSGEVPVNRLGTEARNMIEESSRIARREVFQVHTLDVDKYDILVLPGGYGAINNFSNFFSEHSEKTVYPSIQDIIYGFITAKKPIVSVCIAPLVVAVSLQGKVGGLTLTLGKDENRLLASVGAINKVCMADEFVYDQRNLIYSTPAFMESEDLALIYKGMNSMITSLVQNLSK
ncbi:MAG: thiJ/PfpI domain protein [Candidatus Xenolissoclinum pacificiensis L6]|uniref:ThiJ/PfpI domain protein n=1 Tax=Candidatus Xenolissoclinum pacificiensis L6 TaxID=1401685 RepID=W2V0W8_9RICK|nr:MAG: thiJ/PfpI domain protein [Candidatus Xenolissoclinum pacificiensis L6]